MSTYSRCPHSPITLDYTGTGPVHGVKQITLNGVSRTCAYDLNGNMATSPDFTTATNPLNRAITYDADNMLTRIVHANGATVDFVYDGMGKRTKKLVQSGKTVLYLGDHFEVENGVNIKYIFGGNLRLAMIKGSLTSYFHKDHLGSTAAVTDETGQKKESTTYEPFGSTRTQEGTAVSTYKFTDQELDNETNLYNYDARLYDPVLGMFVTADSEVPDEYDPQELNRYAYCRNNPLIYTDPTGHKVTIEIDREYATGISTPGSLDVKRDVTGKSFDGVSLEHCLFGGLGPLAKGDKTYSGEIIEHKKNETIQERIAMPGITKHEDDTNVTGGIVEIHKGVTVADSTGCILAGLSFLNSDPDSNSIVGTADAMKGILGIIKGEYENLIASGVLPDSQLKGKSPTVQDYNKYVKIDVKIVNTPGYKEYVREQMLAQSDHNRQSYHDISNELGGFI